MTGLQYEFLDIRTLSVEQLEHSYSLMSASRQERVKRMQAADDQRRTIAADHLCRRMLSQAFRLDPESIRIINLPDGRPTAEGLPCHISLSHSGRWVMCALADRPVGADVEVISERRERIVSRICSPAEREYIYKTGLFDPRSFFEIWTAKEAALKRTGKGLSGGLKSIQVADGNGLLSEVDGGALLSGVHFDAVYSIII